MTGAAASCPPAASIRATSSSISRNVRGGLGARTRIRRPRAGLRSMYSSSIASSRIAASVSVSFFSDASPRGRTRRPCRSRSTGRDRSAELLCLAELDLLEAQAQLPVDLVEPVRAEKRQQMRGQPPPVVRPRVVVDRLVADDAVGLRLQPPGRVLVEAGHLVCAGRSAVARAGGSLPHAGTDPRKLVVEFDAR